MTRDGALLPVLAVIAIGAVLGSWLRWGLSWWLNPRTGLVPGGTLAANLIGGYLVGVTVAVLAAHPAVSPWWRLLIITGFLGGLTTFSTFSAESVSLLLSGHWGAALLHTVAHVGGAIAATLLGIGSYRVVAG